MCSHLIHTRPAALPANLSQTAFLMGINRKPFISFPGGGSDSGRSIASSCYYGDPPGPHCLPPILSAIPSLSHFPHPCPCSLLSPSHSPVPAFSATQRGFWSLFRTDLRIGGWEGAAGAAGALGSKPDLATAQSWSDGSSAQFQLRCALSFLTWVMICPCFCTDNAVLLGNCSEHPGSMICKVQSLRPACGPAEETLAFPGV